MNSKMIASLGVDLPEEAQEESDIVIPEPVNPADLVVIDNPNLPPMEDIDTNLVESERQMENLIRMGFDMIKDMSEQNANLAPNFRNAHLERIVMVFQTTADVVKFKSELQLKKKKTRMDEAKFVGLSKGKEKDDEKPSVNTNIFIQKDLIHMLSKAKVTLENDPAAGELVNFSEVTKVPEETK